jgi:hypothetical protein
LAETASREGWPGIVIGFLTALPAYPQVADAAQEAATGGTHAGLAAKAATIEQVHMHLHHTVNCLVGPTGQGFDAKEANPCQKLGSGAIPAAGPAACGKCEIFNGPANPKGKCNDWAARPV